MSSWRQGTALGPQGPIHTFSTVEDDYLFAERGPAVGRGFRLHRVPTRIGREPGVEILLDDRHVSRQHARLVRDAEGWTVEDLGSANGSYLDKVKLAPNKPTRFAHGMRFSVGDSVLRFVAATSPEAAVHQREVAQTMIDAETGLPTRIAVLEELRRLARDVELRSESLTVVVFAIKHLTQLKLMPEQVAVLSVKRVAEAASALAGGTAFVGRIAEGHVLTALPGCSSDVARGYASGILRRFLDPASGGGVCVELSAGVASLGGDRGAADLLVLAETAALSATQRATDIVDVDQPGRTSSNRVVREGYFLVRQLLARGGDYVLVALELEAEREILRDESLGATTARTALDELTEDALAASEEDVEVGLWRDHYVLVAIPMAKHEKVDEVLDAIARAFASRKELVGAHGPVPRSLRTSMIDGATLRERGENALNVLVRDLVGKSAPTGTAEQADLPHPLVALSVHRRARSTPLGRLKITLDSIETSLRFVVACQLGWLGTHGDDAQLAAGAKALREAGSKPLSMGHWEKLAYQLARVLPPGEHPVLRVSRAWLKSGGAPSVLSQKLREAVELRNANIGHGVGHDEHAYGAQERDTGLTHDQLEKALAPFRETELVSVVEIHSMAEEDDDEGGNEYALRLLAGPLEVFRIERRTTTARLRKDWCYLLSSDATPLPLAPLAMVQTCEHCRRVELFFADNVPTGPKGAQVWLRGIATNHAFATSMPWSKGQAKLHALVTGAEGA